MPPRSLSLSLSDETNVKNNKVGFYFIIAAKIRRDLIIIINQLSKNMRK